MSYINKIAYYTEKILTIAFIAIICFTALYSFIYVPEYETFQISDWMINYQGGFVRRGFIGQLLLSANYIHTYNLRLVILIIELVFYIIFFYLIFKIFIKYKWSLLGAIFPIACSTTSIAVYRRDFFMLCLCYFSYKYFFKFIKENKNTALVISIMIMSISIIIYEPVFFVMAPILIMQYWNKHRNILKTVYIFFIPLFCMTISCICRGTKEQVDVIWQSWLPYITQYGYSIGDNIGQAVAFLGKTNEEVFKIHLSSNFGDNTLLVIITLIIVFFLAFFLCTHIPCIDDKKKIIECNEYKNEISKILIFQLLIQLPMFIVLSCDYGRTIPMSLYTSFFIFYFSDVSKTKVYVTDVISRLSDRIMYGFNSHAIFNNAWFYIVLIILFPFQTFVPSLLFDNVIIHSFEKIIKYIL